MLYFSKIKILTILLFTIVLTSFCLSNFTKFDDNFFEKKINLGLDLQGGSYLLLEIDNSPVITQKLQNKLSSLRNYFKDEKIQYKNLKIVNNELISFELGNSFVNDFIETINDEDGSLNPYYPRFKSFEFDSEVNNNLFNLKFSKYGLIELKKVP